VSAPRAIRRAEHVAGTQGIQDVRKLNVLAQARKGLTA
jgi:hypothetical protein